MFEDYDAGGFYDELLTGRGHARRPARRLVGFLKRAGLDSLLEKSRLAEATIQKLGISFTVYTDAGNIDRNWPLDVIPRVIGESQWRTTAAGLKQRLKALNRFIDDVYNEQKILRDGIIPERLVADNNGFREECVGMRPPHGVWANICGTDLVRNDDGEFYVLEDNLRVPSGVSYMLENREVTKRVWPEVFEKDRILPVDDYPARLFDMLASLSPRRVRRPEIVVLTPGIFNSAYFEHAYLAQQMGAELVEGADLVVEDDCVFMRTVGGLSRVDVIYRRIDDLFLDPEVFNEDSVLGVPGLMRAWRKGNVAIANAPAPASADDKAVYAFVPAMIEYYLGEKPILNNVPTWLCDDKASRDYVLEHLEELVVKPVSESGGYGLMIGPMSTRKERAACAKAIRRRPRNWVAQPTLKLSTAPSLTEQRSVAPRHLDLRPFILQGRSSYVTTGGLTRVALREGSLVVNSSQGGGSKDTWIVGDT